MKIHHSSVRNRVYHSRLSDRWYYYFVVVASFSTTTQTLLRRLTLIYISWMERSSRKSKSKAQNSFESLLFFQRVCLVCTLSSLTVAHFQCSMQLKKRQHGYYVVQCNIGNVDSRPKGGKNAEKFNFKRDSSRSLQHQSRLISNYKEIQE